MSLFGVAHTTGRVQKKKEIQKIAKMGFTLVPDAVQCLWLRYLSASSIFRVEVVSRQCRRVVAEFQKQHVLLDRVRDWLEKRLSYGKALCEMLRLDADLAAQFVLCGSCPLEAITGEDWGDDDADCDFWTTSVAVARELRKWLWRHHNVSAEEAQRRDDADQLPIHAHTMYTGTPALEIYNFQIQSLPYGPNVGTAHALGVVVEQDGEPTRRNVEVKRQQRRYVDRALQIITVSRAQTDTPTGVPSRVFERKTFDPEDTNIRPTDDADEKKQDEDEKAINDWLIDDNQNVGEVGKVAQSVGKIAKPRHERARRGPAVDAVRDVMDTFDWDWCKCAWSPNRLTVEGKAAIRDRTAVMRREFRKPSASDHANMMRRLMRYSRRGYHGTVSNSVLLSLLEPTSDDNFSISDHVGIRLVQETDRYRAHLLTPVSTFLFPNLPTSLLTLLSPSSSTAVCPTLHVASHSTRTPERQEKTATSSSLTSLLNLSSSLTSSVLPSIAFTTHCVRTRGEGGYIIIFDVTTTVEAAQAVDERGTGKVAKYKPTPTSQPESGRNIVQCDQAPRGDGQ
jgi:hypothetical protein